MARLAGVSKRTIDYYTNRGLLNPTRMDNNYRYYSEDSLIRLNLIEGMKKKRLTLEEIKENLDLLEDGPVVGIGSEAVIQPSSNGFVNERFNQLLGLLLLLQPVMLNLENPEAGEASIVAREFITDSLSLIQNLVVLIHELGQIL